MYHTDDFYEIKQSDVGRPHIKAFNHVWPVSNFIGRVMDIDVGKRVYQRGEILQVENQEQFETRTK